MLAGLATFVTGCTPAARATDDPRDGATARLARPGAVLFLPEEGGGAAAFAPSARRSAWCRAEDLDRLARAATQPVRALRGDGDDPPDPAAEPFSRAVMAATAAGFGADDAGAREVLARLLRDWAVADALTGGFPLTDNARYALDRALLPVIAGFALLRGDPVLAPADALVVERWLGRLVHAPREAGSEPRETDRNNHAYLRGSVRAAWAALTGDAAGFAEAVSVYRDALADMRRDGSLPLETRRGARALWYQRHALASLVAIAEMAALQGRDLYGLEVSGRDLHLAVRFLLDGIDDPDRVRRYAKANVRPGPESDYRRQDLTFLLRRGHGRHYMAWAEIYMARFPGRPESRRLLRVLAEADPGFRPMTDDYSGGNTTCFFAPVD